MNLERAVKRHFDVGEPSAAGFDSTFVQKYDGPMFAVRDRNTETRWSTGSWNEEEKVVVKYNAELARAKRGCNAAQQEGQ